MDNMDLLEEEKKRFVISNSKWIRFSDIKDWDIFDPKRTYILSRKDNNLTWPIFVRFDSPEGKLESNDENFDGMDFDEFSYRFFDDFFIKEFDVN